MNDCLWKEVEAMTIGVVQRRCELNTLIRSQQNSSTLTVASTVSSSSGLSIHSSTNSFIDKIKQSISKQKERRRTVSTQRLSQITSSLNSSYATPSVRISTLFSPEDVIRQRRISMTLSFPPESPSFSKFSYNSHPTSTHRRIRSVSGYCSHPSSYGSALSSFLHPDPPRSCEELNQSDKSITLRKKFFRNHQQIISSSLDTGLNRLRLHHASSSSITSSLSNSELVTIVNQSKNQVSLPSSYLNVEMFSNEIRPIEKRIRVLSLEQIPPANSWLHSTKHANSSND